LKKGRGERKYLQTPQEVDANGRLILPPLVERKPLRGKTRHESSSGEEGTRYPGVKTTDKGQSERDFVLRHRALRREIRTDPRFRKLYDEAFTTGNSVMYGNLQHHVKSAATTKIPHEKTARALRREEEKAGRSRPSTG
jgi:hypothetical protein